MRRILHLLFFVVLIPSALAQKDCQYDRDGNCIGRGKIKTIKHSTSYGSKYTTSARVGYWLLFNTDGIKKEEGEYRYANEYSEKDGEWKFYSDESVLLFSRWYNNGRIIRTQFLDSGYFAHEGDTVIISADSMGNLYIEERKGRINYRYTATRLQLLNGDPALYAQVEKKKAETADYLRYSEEAILKRYPMIQSTLNVKQWAVNNPLNLINNPGFEEMRDKMRNGQSAQIKPGGEYLAKYWSSANETPDIFRDANNCFAGYRVFGVNYEVLRNELKEPLKAGKQYCMQFKLKLKFENTHAVNGVSVTVSKDLMGFRIPADAIKNGVVLQTHPDLPLACREQWMTISGSFTAKGGERYIYIGNFTPDRELKLYDVDQNASPYIDEIYYYIDDVVLVEQKTDNSCPCNVEGCELSYDTVARTEDTMIVQDDIFHQPRVGQSIVLRNIQFETGKWELLEGSSTTLDSLVELMQKFPTMRVEITGHTDNKGKAADNQLLSFNRAHTVATYLMDYGIDESRIVYRGMGQTQPIDTNTTESGRYNNRRVEFRILSL